MPSLAGLTPPDSVGVEDILENVPVADTSLDSTGVSLMLVNSPTEEPPGLSLPPPKALCTSDITLVTLWVALIIISHVLGILLIAPATLSAIPLALSFALIFVSWVLGTLVTLFLTLFIMLVASSFALISVWTSGGNVSMNDWIYSGV